MTAKVSITKVEPNTSDFGISQSQVIVNEVTGELYTRTLNNQVKRIGADSAFTPSGTGATTRTVQSKLQEVVSIKDFGAVNDWDGATGTDDKAAIQLAVNTGKAVFFPAKSKLSGAVTFNTIGQRFFGSAMELSGVHVAAATNAFTYSGSSLCRVFFEDLSITGQTSSLNAIDFSTATNLYESTFRNLSIYCGGKAIYAPVGEFSNLYDNIQFSSYNDNGIEISGGVYVTLTSCYAHTFSTGKYPYRLYAGAVMVGCNGVDTGDYVLLAGRSIAKGDSADTQYRLTCTGCNFESFKKNGVQLRFNGSAVLVNPIFGTPTVVTSATYDCCIYQEFSDAGVTIIGGAITAGGSTRNKLSDYFADGGIAPIVIGTILTTWDSAGTSTAIPKITTSLAAFATSGLNVNNLVMGRGWGFYSPAQTTWTANSASFSVTSIDRVKTANSSTTNLDNATGGVDGHELTVFVNDANTTIRNAIGGAGRFVLSPAADIACATGETYHFVWNASNSTWTHASGQSRRAKRLQGAALTAANNLTLGDDGAHFQVDGATQINLILNTRWWGGADVTLKFNSTPTVKHNQAASGNNKPIILNGAADLVAAAGNTLTLRYDSTDSTWQEIGRKV